MTFEDVVMECWRNKDLMREYRRLHNSKIGLDTRTPIERMVDEATGHIPGPSTEEAFAFFDFVREFVWDRLPDEAFL